LFPFFKSDQTELGPQLISYNSLKPGTSIWC
jgi:hypothetical protein